MTNVNNFWSFLNQIPWYAWVSIIAILAASIRQLVVMSHRHRERLEMIRQGMDPRDGR